MQSYTYWWNGSFNLPYLEKCIPTLISRMKVLKYSRAEKAIAIKIV